MNNLRDGHDFDNLYLSAKARSEADWLVGINATQALTIAAGKGTYSLGRVQTPTLAMVCRRFLENKDFVPTPFWQMHFTSEGDGKAVKFLTSERWNDKEVAEALYQQLKGNRNVVISKVECKEKTEEPPLLYDLTALQKEANIKYGFTAEQTLAIAQKLYEAKAITYPRTSSRYIPDDVYDEIPKLLKTLDNDEQWGALAMTISKPNRRSVDASKVTDHHALLITGEKLEHPSNDDKKIYNMIVSRMLEAFSEKCVKELTAVTIDINDVSFVAKGTVIHKAGWRFINNDETDTDRLPNWNEGCELPISGWGLAEGKTKAVPIHTEATLLSEMENCGKSVDDDTSNDYRPYATILNEIHRNKDSDYCGGIINKYDGHYPVWAFVEIIPFGSFISFLKYCGEYFNEKEFIDNFYLLKDVKRLRNAAAHNNCILHNLLPNTAKHKTNYKVSRFLAEPRFGITKDIRTRRMSNSAINDIVTLIYTHLTIVSSSGNLKAQGNKLKKVCERCLKHKDYYKSNDTIMSTFDFLKKVVDKAYEIEYN